MQSHKFDCLRKYLKYAVQWTKESLVNVLVIQEETVNLLWLYFKWVPFTIECKILLKYPPAISLEYTH